MRDKKKSDGGVEKKGNVSKVGLEVEVSQEATGRVDVSTDALSRGSSSSQFDLEVRYTYRAEDAGEKSKDGRGTKEEYKTFTYWVRVNVGELE
jgi:dynactin-4